MLFRGFPNECNALHSLKKSIVEMGSRRWSTEWEEHAKPLISQVSCLSFICDVRVSNVHSEYCVSYFFQHHDFSPSMPWTFIFVAFY